MDEISPRYQMELIEKLNKVILEDFKNYQDVEFYIKKWHRVEEDGFSNYTQNFQISFTQGSVDLLETLHSMNPELLLRMAIDLNIDTPDFIPSVPLFKNKLKEGFQASWSAFQKATRKIEEEPEIAVGLANSALESICKEILKDPRIKTSLDPNKTLYDLTQDLIKEFSFYHKESGVDEIQIDEIRNIGSSLLNISKNIEKLRSEGTSFHGKTKEDYLVDNPIYTYFIVNCVTTVGLFLMSFYEEKYKIVSSPEQIKLKDDDSEIKLEDIPF